MIILNYPQEVIVLQEMKSNMDKELGIETDLGVITHIATDHELEVVVGFIGTSVVQDINNQAIGLINSLYIKPEYRKRGFAAELIKATTEQFHAFGIRRVQIEAEVGSVEEKIYRDKGFKAKLVVMEAQTSEIICNCTKKG